MGGPPERISLYGTERLLKSVLNSDPALGNFRNADVLIEGTKIAAVGPDLAVNGAEVIESREHVMKKSGFRLPSI